MRLHETSDLTYLIKEGECDDLALLGDLWLDIYQEYIDEFGLNENFRKYIDKQRALGLKIAELIATGNSFKKTEAEIIKRDIDMLFDEKESQKFDEVVWGLRKFVGFDFDPKEKTVKEYYGLVEYMKKTLKNGQKGNQ